MKNSLLVVILLLFSAGAGAQQILIDQPVRAGELTLFPSHQNADVYYYVLDKARLATDDNGRPRFSLLRYVDNVRSGADERDAIQGEGGAILHALVTLEVTQDQIRDAQRALNRVRPGARIEGPVVYRSGRFALISSFTDGEGRLSDRVLGVGNAPLLDGQMAAISMLLTREGSRILWQSFHTPTPDISFSFEMELDGYRSPQQGMIEADFEQIYSHDAFSVGVASTYLSGEIKGAYEDLTRTGAIRVTQIGDDAKIESLLDIAYRKLTEAMFEPVSSNSPSLASLTSGVAGQQSMLDRATTMLTNSRQEAQRENERIRRENRQTEARAEAGTGAGATEGEGPTASSQSGGSSERATQLEQQAQRAEARAVQLREAADRLAPTDAESAAVFREAAEGADSQATTLRRLAGEVRQEPAESESEAEREQPELQEEVTVPAFAIAASFEMKRVRQRGSWRIDLNKYSADTLSLRFDQNIGDLRNYLDDDSHFRQVNLDDPLYRQRELSVFLDGLNASDFGNYINYVTVQMRKRHASGELTLDEVRIDRNNFNTEGNAFKLMYGWNGDNDRSRWMEYDYRTQWSFHGGHTREIEWQPANFGAIPLTPAVARRQLQLEADQSVLADADVRAVTIKIYHTLGGTEQVQQITLNPAQGNLSATVDYLTPYDSYAYDYEISWLRRGQPTLVSGRQTGTDSILFVDELPGS